MASHAPITGAPTRAPVILPFPTTPLASARLALNLCRTEKMVFAWTRRMASVPLSASDRGELLDRLARRHMEIRMAEGR